MSLPEPAPFDYEAHLLACARGERQALHRLYQHEGARLLGVARRLVRDTALAEDIVHDAFIRIWTGAGGFDPVRGSARGWMFSVTRHLALNVLRRQGREVLVDGTQEAGLDAWLDAGAAGGRQCAQHILARQLVQFCFVVFEFARHPMHSRNAVRLRLIQALTVPSGVPWRRAMSAWEQPST